MSTKVIAIVVFVVLVAFLVCGGAGAFWYFKMRPQTPPDVGPLSGQALVLPADTALVGGFDAKSFFASPGYKQVASGELPSTGKSPEEAEAAKKQLRESIEKGLAEGEAKTGVRFDRDVDRLVVGMSNVAAPQPDAVLIALGRFDKEKIKNAVLASVKAEGRTATTRTIAGVEVIEMTEPGKPSVILAVPDAGRLLVGSEGGVTGVLTAQAAATRPIEGNASLMGLVKGLDPASSYWLVADEPLVTRGQKEAGPGAAAMFPMPKNLTLSGKFEGGLALAAEMADDAAASQVSGMLEGGLGMVKMQAAENPQVEKVPGAKQMLDGLSVKAEGKKVVLALATPSGGGATMAGVLAALALPSLTNALGTAAVTALPTEEPTMEGAEVTSTEEVVPEVTQAPALATTPRPPRPRPTARPTPTARPAAPAAEEPKAPSGPVRVGGDIREPRKIKNVNPVYPDLAKRARVQGVVILECTISADGNVSDVRVLRGQAMLDQAAIDAVRKWVYEPTLLNGTPVPVVLTVTVNFRLN